MRLAGKVAIVTGGARGLGRVLALRLARLGADVVVSDIDLHAARQYDEELSAETVEDEVRALGRRALGIQSDVTIRAEVDAMVGRTLDEFGRLDILVNNAGGLLRPGPGLASSMSEDDYRYLLDVNLTGTMFCSQAASAPLRARHEGTIVNIGSAAGTWATDGAAAHYSLAKAAVHHYTRKLAAELGPDGIRVNCIAPGWLLTSRTIAGGRNRPEVRERLEATIALRRLGLPEDCANVLEFLVTDLSGYVTGQVIGVDGGLSALPILL